MSANSGPGTGKCPVFFCGSPKGVSGFSTFLANAQKMSAIDAQAVPALAQALEKTKDIDYGIAILLVENKNDLVAVLNVMMALKKRVDRGAFRVLAYNLLENDKIAAVLKTKGCAETFSEGLTQKALMHKLQKHLQIVATKAKGLRRTADDAATIKGAEANKNAAADRVSSENAKIKFVAELKDPNDCWLVKNKRDFKFIRGNWIGEMIGPGPSAGSWIEAGGTTKLPIFRWSPRKKEVSVKEGQPAEQAASAQNEPDPFVPGKGGWFFAGRKPEFDWKINRWRFVGETPSLFFKGAEGAGSAFRFRSPAPGSIEVALNSAVAKKKLQAIIATFASDKLIRDDKDGPVDDKEIALEKEKKKARGADYEGDLSPDEDPDDWGELDSGDEAERKWGALKDGKEKDREWDDHSDEGEDEDNHDWSGLDTGRGNKFNGGRGIGQGKGSKGYKPEEEEESENEEPDEAEPDWTRLDTARGNNFGRSGLGQGEGNKSPAKEKRKKRANSGDNEDLTEGVDEEEGDGWEDGDLDLNGKPATGGEAAAPKKRKPKKDFDDLTDDFFKEAQDDRQEAFDKGADLDEILGDPADDEEWDTGENTFDKITMDIAVTRSDAPDAPPLTDISLIERRGSELLLDAPTGAFKLGERMSFSVMMSEGASREKRKLALNGELKSTESSGDGRDVIVVGVSDLSKGHLGEIQRVFERRQEQLLRFLREAKG